MKQFRFVLLLFFLFSCFLLAQTATTSETQALIDLYNATNGPHWTSNSGWTTGDPCANGWSGVSCTSPTSSGSVTQLNLFNNQLSGTIPSSFGNLVNLFYLYLNGNQLSGTIPPSIGNLTNVQQLYLNGNQLSGTIPSSIGNLNNLFVLNLDNNYLTGTLPSTQPATYIYFNNNYFCNKPSWCGSYCNYPTNPFYELYSPVNAVSVNVPSLPYSPTLSDLQIQGFGCDSNFTNYVVFNPPSISSGGNTSVTVSLSNYVNGGSNSGYPFQSVVVVVNVIAPVIITCSPTPVNVSLSSSGTYTLIPSSLATAVSLNGSSLTFSANLTSLSCSNVGTNSILVTATDSQGHSASCSTTVNVNPFISISCLQGVVIGLDSPNSTTTVSSSQVNSAPNPCSIPVNVSPSTVSINNLSSSSINFTVTSSTNSSVTCTSTGYVVINGILNVGSAIRPVGASFIIKWQTSFTSLFSSSSKVILYYLDQHGSKQIINSSPVNYSVGQFDWVQGFPSSSKLNHYYSIFMSINGQIVGTEQVYVIP